MIDRALTPKCVNYVRNAGKLIAVLKSLFVLRATPLSKVGREVTLVPDI
jgi:hypothetical protein